MNDGSGSVPAQLILVFVLILLNAFFAGSEIALISVRKTRIKQLAEEGSKRAKYVLSLLENPTAFMSTVQIGVTMVGFLASAFAAANLAYPLAKFLEKHGVLSGGTAYTVSVVLITVITGLVTLVLGEIAPKSFAFKYSERLSLLVAAPIKCLEFAFKPAVAFITFLANLVLRPFGGTADFTQHTMTEEELKLIVEDSEESGVLEAEETEMIHSIFDFNDTIAREVMVPRTAMDCAPADATLDDLLKVITGTGHSRIPIYKETRDNIIGIVHAKDLLSVLSNGNRKNFNVVKIMRPAYFVPETKEIDELLAEFKKGKTQLAIVRDEYGGTAGIVTVEDILEEIVGEISDEYDREEAPAIDKLDEEHIRVSGIYNLEDLNEELDLNLPESENYDTLAGLVFDLFGRQPKVGETVSHENYDFKVLDLDRGRIKTVLITKNPPAEAEEKE